MVIIVTILSIGIIIFGWKIASVQNEAIEQCFEVKELADRLLTGELEMKYISNSQLLLLRRPIFTHVGMGGVGPSYLPSFAILEMVNEELSRRRLCKVKGDIYG